jgi:hypothetical protein
LDYIVEVRLPTWLFAFNVLSELRKKCLEDAITEDTIAIAHDDDLQLIDSEETLTADAVEKFLRKRRMPLLVENGGMCPMQLQGTQKD